MIHDLRRQGLSISAIARRTGLDRKTVRKYLEQGPQSARYGPREPRPRLLDPYEDYLRKRIAEHEGLSGRRLWRDIADLRHMCSSTYTLLWCVSFYVESRAQVTVSKAPAFAELHIKFARKREGPARWGPRVASETSQRAKPLKQCAVLLPGWDVRKGGVLRDVRKGLALHLEVRPGVDLGGHDMLVAEEVPDDLQRDAALEQVHSLRVPQRVRSDRMGERRMSVAHCLYMLVQDVPHAPSGQPPTLAVLKPRRGQPPRRASA